MAPVLSPPYKADNTKKLIKQIKMKSENTLPPNEVCKRGKFFTKFRILLCTFPLSLLSQGCAQNVFNGFS